MREGLWDLEEGAILAGGWNWIMRGMQHIALFHEQPTRIPTSSSNTPNSPTILHPTSPDPTHALSCRIYDFSRQIDEFILDLQQNAPSLPFTTIQFFSQKIWKNGHQKLNVVQIDSTSIMN